MPEKRKLDVDFRWAGARWEPAELRRVDAYRRRSLRRRNDAFGFKLALAAELNPLEDRFGDEDGPTDGAAF